MMRNKIRISIVVIAVVVVNALLIYNVSGVNSTHKDELELPSMELATGDLVFRNGHGLISRMFQNCSLKEKKYGHTGIVLIKENIPYVAHVQQDRPGPALMIEPLSQFWNKSICNEGAVYRLDFDNNSKYKFAAVLQSHIKKQITFDAKFDMEEHTHVYCSEWIRDLVVETTGDTGYFPISVAGDFRYIAPDNLYLNEHAQLIYNYNKE
jgi:Permuted papain-like amidase enzyme, YaeF/YiiX, C92 family